MENVEKYHKVVTVSKTSMIVRQLNGDLEKARDGTRAEHPRLK